MFTRLSCTIDDDDNDLGVDTDSDADDVSGVINDNSGDDRITAMILMSSMMITI